MASSKLTRRIARSYLTELLSQHLGDAAVETAADNLLNAACELEFRPRSRAGELLIITFELDPETEPPTNTSTSTGSTDRGREAP
jgi:hypothetical protein